MANYIIEFGDNVLNKSFKTDGEAIDFCEYIIDEYEFSCVMHIMKAIEYEDHLGYGKYWALIWTNAK